MPPASSEAYNAAADLLERNLAAGRAARVAYIDAGGKYSYAELAERFGAVPATSDSEGEKEAVALRVAARLALGLGGWKADPWRQEEELR
jgi:hypothetical protein